MNRFFNVGYNSMQREGKRQRLITSRDIFEDVPMNANDLVDSSSCANLDSEARSSFVYNMSCGLATEELDYNLHTLSAREMYFRENNFSCSLLTVDEIQDWIHNHVLKSTSSDHMICSIIRNRLDFREHIEKFVYTIDDDTNKKMGDTILRLYSGMYQDRSICVSVGKDSVTLLSCFWLMRSIRCFISNQFGVMVEGGSLFFRSMDEAQRDFFMNIPLNMMFYVDMNSYQESLMIKEKWDGNGRAQI